MTVKSEHIMKALDELKWVSGVINSCTTEAQLSVSHNLIKRFERKWSKQFNNLSWSSTLDDLCCNLSLEVATRRVHIQNHYQS